MSTSSDNMFLERLRRVDQDRYFATLFAPPARREALALLYLFNNELARAREVASTQTMALIRLQWWREVVEGQAKSHEVATPLLQALNAGVLPREALLALITAREVEAEGEIADFPAFLAYARATGGKLARTAGRLLGIDSPEIEDLGTAYAIAGILRAAPFLARQERCLLPVDGTRTEILVTQAEALLAARAPRAAFAAWAPAAFVRWDLSHAYAPRGVMDRLAVLWAYARGRV